MSQQPPPYPGEIGPPQQPPAQSPQAPYGQPLPQPYWAAARPLNALRGLGLAAAILAGFYTLMLVALAALAFPAEKDLIEDDLSLTAYDAVGFLTFPILLAIFIVTSLWLYKARENAELLRPEVRHARSSGWAWGGWVVPIVSLWFPFQVVRDVSADRNDTRTSALVGWWWATFLISFFLSNITDSAAYGTAAMAELAVVAALTTVIALVLWVLVIRTITDKRSAPQR